MEPEDELIERLATRVVASGLDLPAVLFIEGMKPLAFLGGQFLHFLTPMVTSLHTPRDWQGVVDIVSDRDKVEVLLQRIEAKRAAPGLKRDDGQS